MANNDDKSKEKNLCTTSLENENRQQKTGKFSWSKIVRVKADKTAMVKPAVAYGVVVGVLALAIIIALIVIL